MRHCIFCGTETQYMRDSGPYKLTPYCLDCVAPYGVTGRSDTGHLLDPEILDQFYCTCPDPLPERLMVGVQSHVRDGRIWISTCALTLINVGPGIVRYDGSWKTEEPPYVGQAGLQPKDLNWVTVKRPPQVGETWMTTVGTVKVETIREPNMYPYRCSIADGRDDLALAAFVRRLQPRSRPPEEAPLKYEYKSGRILRPDEILTFVPPPVPQPGRAGELRRQALAQLTQGLPESPALRGRHKF